MNNEIKKKIQSDIEENSKKYPFISKYWEIVVADIQNENLEANETVKFGHYGTEEFSSYPFYKILSKIINFSEIEE